MASWLGLATTRFSHSPSPLVLRTKDGEEKTLADVCKESTPPCRLNPLLFNGHLQTMWTSVKYEGPLVHYKRKVFQADSTYLGSFAVDFAVDPFEEHDAKLPPRTAYYTDEEFDKLGSDDSRPMLIALHGLSGGSYELYLREAIQPLIMDDSNWDVIVVNSRGCANSEITSGVLFNARATWDVRQVVKWAHEKYPNRPLFGIGFSLGANIITNYVGEEGAGCLLKACIAVGNPFDLEVSSKAMQNSALGLNVYSKVMGNNLKRLIAKHKESLLKHSNLDFDVIEKVTYLHEFDRAVQCQSWGYPTESAYYRDASSSDSILAIRIPYFAISAADDPVAVDQAVPYQEFKVNPYTVHCSTSLGGHLSWFELGGGRWHARPVVNFLREMAANIDLNFNKAKVSKDMEPKAPDAHGFDPMRRRMRINPRQLKDD
ncbi:hypothetical protein PpBr36_02441 [Pyricularia pennisetigena]|uniref:hypothetical protein n=1 Tax=Pyricularia pennisetigena TaxID=1578925 RepID=UPI0011510820|nr:hypothetical protein PpBr36_02441 [Pyricularia pennisetigena]TLS30387.1 hypothetical protein PpBr36_02441 [Pyricularia pennisetigena]